MKIFILIGIVLILISLVVALSMNKAPFVNYIAHYAPKSQRGWWRRPGWERFGYPFYSYWENFEDLRPTEISNETKTLLQKNSEDSPILEFPPNTPSPADLYNNQPYHILSDELEMPRVEESLSCVNSRSCYATDFERMVSKTGNYRQMTNNYKRGYPDSCSAPYQELVLNFYKADKMELPINNTG